MKRQTVGAAVLLLSGLLLTPGLAASNNDSAQGGAAAKSGVSKAQLELMNKRAEARQRLHDMLQVRAQSIEAQKKADEEAARQEQ